MQKKFSFRLDKILRLKAQKALEIEESLNMVVNLREKKESELQIKEDYYSEISNQKTLSATADVFQMNHHHLEFVSNEIDRLKDEKVQLLEIENLRRARLTEIRKEKKILEKLKEKKKDIHNKEMQTEETKMLDEIGITRFDVNSENRI